MFDSSYWIPPNLTSGAYPRRKRARGKLHTNTEFDPGKAMMVILLVAEGMKPLVEAARIARVPIRTVSYVWKYRYPEFRATLNEAVDIRRKRCREGGLTIRTKVLAQKNHPAQVHLRRELGEPEDLSSFHYEKPRFRSECEAMPRPCPFVSCRFHMFLDVNPKNGSIKFNWPGRDLRELEDTCVLDVVDKEKDLSFSEIGDLLNISHEAARQTLEKGIRALKQEAALRELA